MVVLMSCKPIPQDGVLLGVDFGLARIGIARSDSSRLLASPCTIIPTKGRSIAALASAIMQELQAYSAVAVVMGWPDEEDERTRDIRAAIQACRTQLEKAALPVVYVFESFSSREAIELLHASGKKKKPGQHLDDWAAAVILQRYLDAADEFVQR